MGSVIALVTLILPAGFMRRSVWIGLLLTWRAGGADP